MPFLNHLASLVVNIVVNTKQFNSQINNVNTKLSGVVKNAARFYLIRAAFLTVTNALEKVVKIAAEVEQGFINIERVAQHLKNTGFRDEIAKLAADLPGIKLQELQKALKVTAQLGIQAKEEMIAFAKQVAMLATVTGIPAEQIASDLGKIATVFKINPKEISHFINAVLQLSDDMTVTEEEIFNITEKLGGFAHEIGLSATETAAFAAAMKAAGQSTEVSRTALFQLFSRLVSHPGRVADALNITKQQMQDLFVVLRQDPKVGIMKFLELLQGKSPGEIIQALETLKIAGRNTSGAVIALIGSLTNLDSAFKASQKGAEDDVRLLQQLNSNAEGLTSKINDLSDAWDRLMASVGNSQALVDVIDRLTSIIELVNEALNLDAHVSIDFRDPNAIRNRLAQLKAEQKAWEELANKVMNAPWYEGLNPINALMNTGRIVKGAEDEKTRMREMARLKELLRKLETPEKEKTTGESKRDTPTTQQARQEFNKLFESDQKKSKSSREKEDKFKGFMGLEEAWKNRLLDEQKAEEKNFKKLDEIFKENTKQTDALDEIVKNTKKGTTATYA